MFALDEAGAWTTIVLIVADAALKGVAVLAVAALATVLLRRASAAARHLVWFTAVVGVLMLPVLSAWLPGWQVLPRVVDLAAVPTVETVPAEIPIPAVIEVLDLTPVSVPLATDRIEMPMPTEATPSEPIAQVPEHVPAAPAAVVEHRGRVSIWTGLLLVWALGAAVALLPVSLGVLSLWWLTRTSRPIVEDPWSALLGELTAVLGLRRRPLLLQSPRRSVPMTFGALAGIIPASMPGGRAKVLIPEDASDWSAQRCRAVLLHELAHIKRFDCLTQLITQLACAVHWFNPLIWLASRRMLAERERACDDLVLAEGTKSSDYAEHILQIVASQPARPFAAFAGIRFARRSKLEGRLVAILDKNRNRRALTRLTVAATIVLLTAIVVPVAMLRSAELRNPVQIDSNGNFVVTHVLYIHGQPNAPLFVLEDASYHDIDEVVAHIKRLMKHEPFPYIRVRASRAHRVNQSLIDDLGKRCRAIGFINMEYRYDLLGATSMPAELRFLSYEHQRKVSPEGPWFTAIQTYWLPNGERRDTTEDRRLLGAFHELGDPDARPPDGLSWLYMWFAGPPGEGLLSGSAKLLGAKERVIASSGDNRNEIPRPELEHRPWLMFRFALPTDRIPPVANVELEYAAADKSGRPIRPLHRVLYRNISLKPGHRTDVRVAPSGPAKGLAASIRPRNGNDREVAQLAIDLIAAVRVGDRQRCDELLGGGGGLALELTGYSRSHDLTQLKLHAVYAGGKALLITTQPLSSKVGEPIVLRILLLRESGQWHGRIVESGATGSHGDYVKRLRGQYPDLKAIKVDPELVPRAAPAPAPTVTFAYDHFIGTYADARQPDRSWFKITRKGDTYVAHSIGGPSHEMEMASDGLTFTDPAERFTFRYDTSTNRYELRLHSKSDPQPKTVGVFDLVKVTGKNSQPESPPRGKGFSPVTEHTLSTPTVDRRNAFVDLDRGRIVVPPHELDLTDRQAVWEWAEGAGVDTVANASEQFEGLLGYELIPAQSAYSRWDRATRESISRATGKVSFRDFKFPNGDPFAQHVLTMKSAFNRPTTYVFRTREGAMGVLQFVNRDDPNGFVKFRYKLAQAEAKADASPWGDAVEGVQCRLRADKLVWQAGETPTFSVDARWNGTAMAFGHGDAMLELQFDGQWYDIAIDDHAVDRLSLDSPWFRSERGRVVRPALTSGKHVVRAAILGAVSNPVEIEIREADGAKSAARLMFHGLDLAAAPRSTKSADLPDLWEEQPPGSRSYHIRKEVKVVYSGLVGTVYHVPAKGVFYIQHDRLGSSTRTYYGPFKGDLAQVLKLDAERAAWGQTVNGLQLGLSFDLQDRAYQVGELVSFVVHVRNVGDELVTLVDFTGTAPEADRAYLMGWAPTVRDGAGKRLRVATPPIDHPVQTRRRTLLPGEFMPIGVILLRIDAGPEDRATAPHLQLEPGNYHVSQTYRFAQHEKAAWSGELTTGELSLRVVPIESE